MSEEALSVYMTTRRFDIRMRYYESLELVGVVTELRHRHSIPGKGWIYAHRT
jgi:hypothetical protein